MGRHSLGLGRVGALARGLAPGDGVSLGLDRGRQPGARRREVGLETGSTLGRRARLGGRLVGASLDLGQPPSGRLVLGLARRRGAPEGGQLLALSLARGAQCAELGEGVGQLAVRLGEHPLEVEIARRDRCRQRATPGGQLGFGRGPFVEQAPPIAFQRLELRGEARVANLRRADGGLRCVMGLASLAFERGPDGELAGQRRRGGLRGDERGHRPIGGVTRRVSIRLGDGQPSGGLVPACVHREQQGARELVRGGLPGRLLLGLGGQPAGLRAELAEDVLCAGQVRLGLDELFFRSAAPALMAADPGDLLEQRSPLLGAQGEGLVDHALPDEQEGVVGEVGGVEQVDQVAQPDPALVEEVVVLARAVQPAAELEHLEVDRQEPVGVVEHERDIRHALGGALVRSGPDDVLRAPRAKRPALLTERPAQGIGEVALARPVRPDDGADAGAELHVRALGKGLEALEAKRQQARLGGRPVGQRHAPVPS